MIVILRGHLRESFENPLLYKFIKCLGTIVPNMRIYIHTWNVYSNSLSWRKIQENNKVVTKEIITGYFKEVSNKIEEIIIDDDTNIPLVGNLEGTIQKTKTPTRGWKNYLYGLYHVSRVIYERNENKQETILSLRFDLFNNSNNFTTKDCLSFVMKHKNYKDNKLKYIFNECYYGIDNIFLGTVESNYIITNHFHFHLDDILLKEHNLEHQEFLFYRVNHELFAN